MTDNLITRLESRSQTLHACERVEGSALQSCARLMEEAADALRHHSTPDSSESVRCPFTPPCDDPNPLQCLMVTGGGCRCNCICHAQSSALPVEVGSDGSRSEHRPVDPQTNPSSSEAGDTARLDTAERQRWMDALAEAVVYGSLSVSAEACVLANVNGYCEDDPAQSVLDDVYYYQQRKRVLDIINRNMSAPDTARTPEVNDG